MSDFPRQDTSWEAVPDATLAAPEPFDDLLGDIEHDDVETQLKKLEQIKQEQQERISKLLVSIKEKRRREDNSKAATKKFSDSEKESIRTVFDKYDSNKSGFIEPAEFQKMVEELGVKISESSIPSIVKSLASPSETDRIDFDAFLAWWGCDSTRGGNKGLALAIARGKLKALRSAKKGSDRAHAAKLKASIGLPIEIDTNMTVGEVRVPRTQVNVKVSTSRQEDFEKISQSKFPDTKMKIVAIVSLVVDLSTDVPPERMQKFKEAIPLVMADIQAANTEGEAIMKHTIADDTCTFDIAINMNTDKLLSSLFCTTNPEQEDFDKFISEAEMDVRLGADLSELLRESYKEGKSMIDILNDGLTVGLKARISPSIIALGQAVIGSLGEKSIFIRKCAEVGFSSLQSYSCNIAHRSRHDILSRVTGFITNEVRKEISKLEFEAEEEQIENELRMLSNLLIYNAMKKTQTMSLANYSPAYKVLVKNKKLLDADTDSDDDDEDEEDEEPEEEDDEVFPGWNNNLCSPADFLFLLSECISEVKCAKAWSPWAKVSIEGTGLHLSAGLPRDVSEIRDAKTMIVTNECAENRAAIRI